MHRIPPLRTISDQALDAFENSETQTEYACALVLWHMTKSTIHLEMLSDDGGELTLSEFTQLLGEYVLLFAHPELSDKLTGEVKHNEDH